MGIRVEVGAKPDEMQLARLVNAYRYGRYCENVHLSLSQSQAFELYRIESSLSRDDSIAVSVTTEREDVAGVLIGRCSDWDSNHFGYGVAVIDYVLLAGSDYGQDLKVAELLVSHFVKWCLDRQIRFISVRLSSLQLAAIHALEQIGFRYIESYVANVYDLSHLGSQADGLPQLRLALPAEQDVMLRYSPGAFATQRFHADPNIDPEKADDLYRKWILSAFSDPQREILVMEVDDKPAAFMICQQQDLRSQLGYRSVTTQMALLDPDIRSKGLGTDFFMALFRYYRDAGLDMVESGLTMRNQVSLNWHNKLGFRIVSTQLTLHRWLA